MIAVSYFAWLVKLDPFAHARSFCDASKDVLLFLSIEIFPPHPPKKIFIGIGLSSPQTNAIKFFYNILRTILTRFQVLTYHLLEDRCMEYLTMKNFLLLYYKKNRFHVAEDPFSSKSQKKLKFGKNINISLGCASCAILFVATAHASSFYAIGLMDRDTFTEGFRRPSDHDRFSWRTIMPVVNLISIQFQ